MKKEYRVVTLSVIVEKKHVRKMRQVLNIADIGADLSVVNLGTRVSELNSRDLEVVKQEEGEVN